MQTNRPSLAAIFTAITFVIPVTTLGGNAHAEQQLPAATFTAEKRQFVQKHNIIANQYQQLQLLVSGINQQGSNRDFTHAVKYESAPSQASSLTAPQEWSHRWPGEQRQLLQNTQMQKRRLCRSQ